MSLLRDALRARKEKEKGQSTEPMLFNGPVIDADEIVGNSSTISDSRDGSENYSELDTAGFGNEEKDVIRNLQNADEVPVGGSEPAADSVEFSLLADDDPVVPQRAQHRQPSAVSVAVASGNEMPQRQTEQNRPVDSLTETPIDKTAGRKTPGYQSLEYESLDNQSPERQSAEQQSAEQQSLESQSSGYLSSGQMPPEQENERQPESEHLSTGRAHRATSSLPARSMNLDPLFFIIIAFAFAGLFGSLYALVTQNDEFVSREYNELRARQSALNQLIAQQRGQNEATKNIEELTPTAIAGPGAQPVEQSAAPVVDSSEAGNSISRAATATTVSEPEYDRNNGAEKISQLETVDINVPERSNESNSISSATARLDIQGGGQEIAALQDDLNELRQSLASQNLRISEFINENSVPRQSQASSSQTVQSNRNDAIAISQSDTRASSQDSTQSHDKAGNVTIVERTVARPDDDFSLEKSNSGIPAATANSGSAAQIMGQRATDSVNINDNSAGFPAVVGQAFHAYSTGNLNQAGALYARALQLDPYNRDANLGVAAVAMKTANYPIAIQRYRHLLSLQPDDAVAFSAMLSLVATTRDAAIENEMIVHAHQYRQIPSLHAALGNYYSQTARWGKASQSYTTAVGLAPDVADYLFNLAVSLDNLGDSQAAIETYDRALSLSEVSAYTFSVVEASARLQALQAN